MRPLMCRCPPMLPEPRNSKRVYHNFSFYGTVAGIACAAAGRSHPKAKVLAGCLALTVAFGYLGVLWERFAKSDVRNVRQIAVKELEPAQFAIHGAIGYAGYRWLTTQRKSP